MLTLIDPGLVPNVTVGVFIGMAFLWGWLSDGPFRGRRYPFIYAGAVINVRGLSDLKEKNFPVLECADIGCS